MDEHDLVDTTEMYLKSVLELEEEGVTALRARIAERLEQAGPTVSQTVARMQRDGLLVVSDDRHLELTTDGRREAVSIMRKHRIAERLLADVIGLEWELVHEEACRWEHVMSDEVTARIVELLDGPTSSPYGNPIPGTGADDPAAAINLVRLVTGATEPVVARIRWIGEPVQVYPHILGNLRRAGVVPEAEGEFSLHGPAVQVRMSEVGEELELPLSLAGHVFAWGAADESTG